MKTFEKFIPLEYLPNEVQGGKAGPLKDLSKEQIQMLEDHRAWFLDEQDKMLVNENLRPGKGKSDADLFGVEGTFKKLEID